MSFPRVYNSKDYAEMLHTIQTRTSDEWHTAQQEHVVDLYQAMATRVPAFRKFLQNHGIDPSKRQTYDFVENELPSISKKNYVREHSFAELAWDGILKTPAVFTATSGSTGEPTYFMRSRGVDQEAAMIHELFYERSCDPAKPTLVIICFGMGIWIGGVITYHAFQQIADRGAPISMITPGVNMQEILRALKSLAPSFEQVILAGYPPFLKDVLDEARQQNIPLHNCDVRLLFAAEPFTDRFRDHVAKQVGSIDPLLHTMNIYGTADLGANAFETPLSIMIRNLTTENPNLFKDLFPEASRTPTLGQYIPIFTSFTTREGELYMSGDSAIPLVSYAVGDRGGVINFDEMRQRLAKHNTSLEDELKSRGIEDMVYELPFVYVYERADFSVSIYGLQVYPEPIREALLEPPFDTHCTGRCTLATRFDEQQNQYLEINIELQEGIVAHDVDESNLLETIVRSLRSANAEFRELSDSLKDRAYPRLVFWPHGDETYFARNIKQRWVT